MPRLSPVSVILPPPAALTASAMVVISDTAWVLAREPLCIMNHLDITHGVHHDAPMRTTLTLEPDVARRLESEMKRSGEGMKTVLNRALRLGLGMTDKPIEPGPFRVEPHSFGFRPGTDLDRLNQIVDELDAEEAARKLGP